MAKWYHSLTKHHKMEWNKTNSLWHVLPSLFPCILCPFIIVLTQASNIQWPPQGTPNGTTKSSLCCTLTLPTACDAFSADSVISWISASDTGAELSTICGAAMPLGSGGRLVLILEDPLKIMFILMPYWCALSLYSCCSTVSPGDTSIIFLTVLCRIFSKAEGSSNFCAFLWDCVL